MNKEDICVVIPIYKECLNDYEIQSVEQCIKVLSDYSICFVAPNGLNLDFYKSKFESIKQYVFFDESYFKDIAGYNRLLLSVDFYKKFTEYKYMLLYQTDCYVFRDELLDWANKGYDYIGGIWFENYHGIPQNGAEVWFPGNGGLSLRKIEKMISVLSTSIYPLKSFQQLFVESKTCLALGRKAYFLRILKILFHFISSKNSFKYYLANFQENEDVLFMELSLNYRKLNIPVVTDCLDFSWDRLPSFLYDKLGKLPFGCHAWYRNDHCYDGNKEFWLKHIDNTDDKEQHFNRIQ